MSGSYPFIDIVALDSVREGFARGNAQLVLTRDLNTVLWANGAGARLFGFDHVDAILANGIDLTVAARRQIELALSQPEQQRQPVSIRLGATLTRISIRSITLNDGTSALLLEADGQSSALSAVIDGLGDENTFVALIDATGEIVAASGAFSSFAIARSTIEDLIVEARDAVLLKRRIRAGHTALPGAIARIKDDPALHILLVVAEKSGKDGQQQPASEAIPATPASKPFVFDPEAGPARFVWRINADGVFSEISPEFAIIVGPNAADVTGRRFVDVANVFGFDTDGTIAGLLQQRGTWSGVRVLWPVEGTSLRVPVELAALPVYSRDRDFIGYRGFGLVRPAEAENDPEQIGLALAGGIPQHRKVEAPRPDDDREDDTLALTQEIANDDRPVRAEQESEVVVELINACAREKVAADAERQTRQKERTHRPEGGLTPSERNAFREIAERLRRQGLAGTEQEKPPFSDTFPAGEAPASADFTDEVKDEAEDISLLAHLPVPVIIHSGGVVHYVNQAFLDLSGYASIEDIEAIGSIDALFNSEPDDSGSSPGMVLRCADGSEQIVDAHLNAVPWRGGRALMLSLLQQAAEPDAAAAEREEAAAKDEALSALQAAIDELETILDTATDGIVLIDSQGRIRSMNNSAAALFGYERADTEGKYFAMLFAAESQRIAMDYLHSLSGNGVLSVLNDGREVIGREAKGGHIPLFMTIGKLPQSGGYCAVLRDITHWKRTEEELTNARKAAERASSQKTDFLARISHEIRTPLNAIIGFSELMADEKFGPIGNERYKDYLRDINRSGNHVLALVNDLLDISKIEAGGLDMQFEAVSLNDAIAEAIALMQPQANRERVIIRSSFQSNLPDIVADARSIKQVALNLLSNAVRFTPPGGQVIISTSYELNGDVALRVRDTGIGMTRAEIEQAMKPFQQVNAAQSRVADNARDWRNEGTGLGLPLTKAMVEANRAHFTIDSIPGRGTVVEVIFPPTRVLAG
ncbi:PAS domain S-box protein [Daeguia caeni]|uniref:histidine kinase n=1 Tax=Daeguia caeni TaxID=439612 RepID=A0ABV9H505_9HYPH